jgi:predicted RNase H-like nuclease
LATRRGPDLPYSLVAAVTSWRRQWIVASAKMHTATFAPQTPKLYDSFTDVLSERPAFSVIVVNAPIGYLDQPGSNVRTCDREARALLGRRASTIQNAPTRSSLFDGVDWRHDHLDAISAMMLPRYREVAAEMSPFRQRIVYEGHPELSFYQLNGNKALRWSKKTERGRLERRQILEKKMQGIRNLIDSEIDLIPEKYLLDVAAMLWTARRVFGHAARRLPSDGEYDSEGLRMELVL